MQTCWPFLILVPVYRESCEPSKFLVCSVEGTHHLHRTTTFFTTSCLVFLTTIRDCTFLAISHTYCICCQGRNEVQTLPSEKCWAQQLQTRSSSGDVNRAEKRGVGKFSASLTFREVSLPNFWETVVHARKQLNGGNIIGSLKRILFVYSHFVWKREEKDLLCAHSVCQCPRQPGLGQTRAGSPELHPGSSVGGRDTRTWAIICCFPGYTVAVMDRKCSSQDWDCSQHSGVGCCVPAET